jgi:hypothetical protein
MTKIKHTAILRDRAGTITIEFNLAPDLEGMKLSEFLGFIHRFEREIGAGMQRELGRVIEQMRTKGNQRL